MKCIFDVVNGKREIMSHTKKHRKFFNSSVLQLFLLFSVLSYILFTGYGESIAIQNDRMCHSEKKKECLFRHSPFWVYIILFTLALLEVHPLAFRLQVVRHPSYLHRHFRRLSLHLPLLLYLCWRFRLCTPVHPHIRYIR